MSSTTKNQQSTPQFYVNKMNTSNQQTHLTLVANIWGAIKVTEKYLASLTILIIELRATTHKRNKLILNFMDKIMMMNVVVLNMSNVGMYYKSNFATISTQVKKDHCKVVPWILLMPKCVYHKISE